jgi:hypothetical protein
MTKVCGINMVVCETCGGNKGRCECIPSTSKGLHRCIACGKHFRCPDNKTGDGCHIGFMEGCYCDATQNGTTMQCGTVYTNE